MNPTRRTFLSTLGALAALGAPGPLRAATPGSDRKFVFVFADGGWDTTRVFAPEFDNAAVDMEPDAERLTLSGIPFVDHPQRPSVRAFLEAHAARTVLFNGVLVRSIAHDICRMIAMTGDSSGLKPDWPALLATGGAAGPYPYTVPHLVLGGPSFPGPLGAAVARTGGAGQLEALINGDIVAWSDSPPPELPLPVQNIVDSYLQRRAGAQLLRVPGGQAAPLYAAHAEAVRSASSLRDLKYVMDFTGGASLSEQATVATSALSIGITRCVTLSEGGLWDTHENNDVQQTARFESLFSGLARLMEQLEGTPGTTEPTLADETTVVVLSEMGRTPMLNGFLGKDHWPYTSVMVVGTGLQGGRVIGGYDELFYGKPVDPASGEVGGEQILSIEAVGATLLAMADIDPGPIVLGVEPIVGVLS
jgi:uncharacterized protein (DUF1501 family)